MDSRCRVEILGSLRLVKDDQFVTRFGAKKTAALLAYLALRSGPQPREQLLDLFWPEMDLPAGRNNLSYTLTCLRRLIEPAGVRKGSVLVTDHTYVGFAPSAVSTDLTEFETLLEQSSGMTDVPARVELLERAMTLWRGDPLPGIYDDWAVLETERLQVRLIETLDRLADDLETLGQYAEAASVSQRRLAADPYTEETYLSLMRRYVQSGQSAAAREVRRKFEQFTREEFGAEPSRDTIARMDEIFSLSILPSSPRPVVRSVSNLKAISEIEPNALTSSTLPFWLSRFFGREPEVAQLAELLLGAKGEILAPELPEPPCSLVTLVGLGGAGKTRLAAEFGRQVAGRLGHWCGFVPLAELTTPEQIPEHIAATFKIQIDPQAQPLEQICTYLRSHARSIDNPLLLILDNLEHLLGTDAVAKMVQVLLKSTPQLAILCTSRRRLGLQGERLISVGPLPLPENETLAEMSRLSSVRLYLDRAQSVRPDFALTPTNAAAVAGLCRRLEGSPLALELAASWVRLLPPRTMWERLTQGQRIPDGRLEDLPERHRSLSAALDWSWRLLTEPQRRLLAHLSVFRGGWDLEAAEAVCPEPDVLELLADLQEASMLAVQEDQTGETRYRLLETVRQYAADRLKEYDAENEVRTKHRDYYLSVGEDAAPHLFGVDRLDWFDRLETDHDNLRAALEWSLTIADVHEESVRIAGAIWPFWNSHGHTSEGRQWMTRVLARPQDGTPTRVRAKAFVGAGTLAMIQSAYDTARHFYQESLVIRRLLGDGVGVANSLNNLGVIATDQGHYEESRAIHTEALELRRRHGDEVGIARSLTNLARSIEYAGNRIDARPLYEEALAIRRRLNDEAGMSDSMSSLGSNISSMGDHETARALHTEALEINQRCGYEMGIAIALTDLGQDAQELHEYDVARQHYKAAMEIWERMQNTFGVAHVAECASSLAMMLGQTDRAVRLHSAAEAVRRPINCPIHAVDQQDIDELLTSARALLGDAKFAAAEAEGEAMSYQQVIDYVLSLKD